MNDSVPADREQEPRQNRTKPLVFVVSVLISAYFYFMAFALRGWPTPASLGPSIALAFLGGAAGGMIASYHTKSPRWTAFLLPLAVTLVIVLPPTIGYIPPSGD